MIHQALQVLNRDKVLRSITDIPINIPDFKGGVDHYLYHSIISQQLSVKSADAIYSRFVRMLGTANPEPAEILKKDLAAMRNLGISGSKSKYIHNVAAFFQQNQFSQDSWVEMSDNDIIQLLTKIKGVGIWTVQMVLIFCMSRPDVFPSGDLGIRNAMELLYRINTRGKASDNQLMEIAEHWKPYRSIASLYLWSWRNRIIQNG